ncbi:MAG TPA: LysR family transcriptional regulator [Aromatoleum sp.]|uniref:LysR family transcriptional regulator n=1 Tax=Aromatoleum sp. TaxID=2307007 RepID=UPI002B490656|nr:LysR family transcriptional regulator [Aromatoleum sp.]HJV24079.1 LysR family transcriptional regulator [Aromatoleum sp.]
MKQLHDVDLKLVRVFVAVVRHGGFSAAQAALNVSQSTISEQMTTLEGRLGLTLCERGRGGFRLTEHGHATYEAAQRLLLAVESFCMDTSILAQRISGRLQLGLIDNTVTDEASPLPAALQRFVALGHDVQIDIYIGSPAELEARVLDGRLHVAIGHFPLQVAGLDYSLLYDEADGLFCGKDHPLHATQQESDAQQELISTSRVVARAFLQERDLRLLKARAASATVDNVEAQAILILSGAYIGFLPLHYAQRWVDSGRMRRLRPQSLETRWPFTVVTRRGMAMPALLRAFIDGLRFRGTTAR